MRRHKRRVGARSAFAPTFPSMRLSTARPRVAARVLGRSGQREAGLRAPLGVREVRRGERRRPHANGATLDGATREEQTSGAPSLRKKQTAVGTSFRWSCAGAFGPRYPIERVLRTRWAAIFDRHPFVPTPGRHALAVCRQARRQGVRGARVTRRLAVRPGRAYEKHPRTKLKPDTRTAHSRRRRQA